MPETLEINNILVPSHTWTHLLLGGKREISLPYHLSCTQIGVVAEFHEDNIWDLGDEIAMKFNDPYMLGQPSPHHIYVIGGDYQAGSPVQVILTQKLQIDSYTPLSAYIWHDSDDPKILKMKGEKCGPDN